MPIITHFTPLAEVAADWLIVGVYEGEEPSPEIAQLDAQLGGTIGRLRQSEDITGKALELTPLRDCQHIAARRVLVVGLGKLDEADRAELTGAAAAAARSLTGKQLDRLAFALPTPPRGLGWEEVAVAVAVGLMQGSHGPGLLKSKPERFPPREIALAAPHASTTEMQRGARRGEVLGRAIALARELVDTPPSDLYPETFAGRALRVAREAGVDCTVLDERQLEAERLGALLAVARGSDRPPRFVVLRYRRGGEGKTLGLVGKGVTFDSGGLSLKTTEQMLDMKCDMAGAATVLSAVAAIAELELPVNVDGYLPLVENLPSGHAMKLGDVLHARNGKTIEVHNTDAEGRLILADALAYAVEQKVSHLVDLATLTGACMVALGVEVAGLMSNNDAWRDRVQEAARRAGEKAWPLPMFPHYTELIKSHVADIKNTGGTRYGGAITAAKFLEEFVGETPWAHLDIAGPAWVEHENATHDPGGTGCFVRTLVELARMYPET
ncbi:MAG: leucyl aminopeptidase [Gemmataceae bacterium]|nr:leucyl aminopeptidase [Gemmataceae bacterium]